MAITWIKDYAQMMYDEQLSIAATLYFTIYVYVWCWPLSRTTNLIMLLVARRSVNYPSHRLNRGVHNNIFRKKNNCIKCSTNGRLQYLLHSFTRLESESESERYLFDPHKKLIQSNNEKQLGSGDPY